MCTDIGDFCGKVDGAFYGFRGVVDEDFMEVYEVNVMNLGEISKNVRGQVLQHIKLRRKS